MHYLEIYVYARILYILEYVHIYKYVHISVNKVILVMLSLSLYIYVHICTYVYAHYNGFKRLLMDFKLGLLALIPAIYIGLMKLGPLLRWSQKLGT